MCMASLGLAQPKTDHVPGRILVQTRGGANPTAVAQALSRAGVRVEKNHQQINVSVLNVPEPNANQISAELASTGLFTFVERDGVAHSGQSSGGVLTPNDPDFPSQ